MLRIALAAIHLLALGVGFSAIRKRAGLLLQPANPGAVRGALRADAEWGIASVLWIVTGLWRYLGGIEKPTIFYNYNHVFLAKMGVFLLIFALEIWPMITLARWRNAIAKGSAPESVANVDVALRIAKISWWQTLLLALMVVLAAAMARGVGAAEL